MDVNGGGLVGRRTTSPPEELIVSAFSKRLFAMSEEAFLFVDETCVVVSNP